jgi:hypothetical protein
MFNQVIIVTGMTITTLQGGRKMTLLRFILLIVLCITVGVAWGQPVERLKVLPGPAPGTLEQLRVLPTFKSVPNLEALHKAALKGIDQYRLMVNVDNLKALGLDQPADATRTELGTPSKDYFVRLDKLKNYKGGDDPEKLLSDTGRVHYPVVLDNEIRSTITIAQYEGEWKVASIGAPNRSEKRSIALKESASRLNKPGEDHFTVRVPALNVEFEAVFDSSNRLQLTPILDFPEWGLKAGVPEPASDVFLRLVTAAKDHDGLPR